MTTSPMTLPLYSIGMSELLVILVIVLIFFGAGKLPDVLKSLGQGMKAFRDASTGSDDKKELDVTPPAAASTEKVPEAEELRRG